MHKLEPMNRIRQRKSSRFLRKSCKKKKMNVILSLTEHQKEGCRMKNILWITLAISIMYSSITWADCENFKETPYVPEDFQGIEYEPWELECCCFNNDIQVVSFSMDLLHENTCCTSEYSADCDTYSFVQRVTANPQVTSGEINKFAPGGQVVVTGFPIMQIITGELCLCSGGVIKLCESHGTGAEFWEFVCEECPE
ncbi:MAG: hypothetical protein R3F46_10085 [bacterium]